MKYPFPSHPKILLIKLKEPHHPNQKASVLPPIGLWYIRSNCHRADIDICDMHIGDEPDFEKHYDIIGISAQFSIQHLEYERIAKLAKNTGAFVVAGGFHAAAVDRPPGVDEVVHGAGEYWFAERTGKKLRRFEDINHPVFAVSEIARYWDEGKPHDLRSKTNRWITFETSRSCVRDCAFCGVSNFWGKHHTKSMGSLHRYLEYLEGRGVHELFIEDDNIALLPTRLEACIELFKAHKMAWSCPNGIEIRGMSKVMHKLKDSGCWRLSLPFETANKTTAIRMNMLGKWIKSIDAKRIVRALNDLGIETCGFFIIGFPGETLDDMQKTLDYANSLPLTDRHIYIATPYPGTPLYDMCLEKNYLISKGRRLYKDLLYSKALIRTPEFKPKQVFELRRKDRNEALRRKENGIV